MNNTTLVVTLLDESGSMLEQDKSEVAVLAFNQFVKDQNNIPGCYFSLHVFSDRQKIAGTPRTIPHLRTIFENVPSNIVKFTRDQYDPEGSTPLYDALSDLIDLIGMRLSLLPEYDRPSKVIFVVITDGQENSSKHTKYADLMEKIKHQQEKYSWEFVFAMSGVTYNEFQSVANFSTTFSASDSKTVEASYASSSRYVTSSRTDKH